jgi:hypothetical protein
MPSRSGHERLLVALAEHRGSRSGLFTGRAGGASAGPASCWNWPRRLAPEPAHAQQGLDRGWARRHHRGRNLGDAYFDAASSTNFHDLDVVLAGDAVAGRRAGVRALWRSPLARPAGEVSTAAMARDALARLREEAEAAGGVLPAEARGRRPRRLRGPCPA